MSDVEILWHRMLVTAKKVVEHATRDQYKERQDCTANECRLRVKCTIGKRQVERERRYQRHLAKKTFVESRSWYSIPATSNSIEINLSTWRYV